MPAGEVVFAVDGIDAGLSQYWFAHASNAARSGTTQQGVDDSMYWFSGNALDSTVTLGGAWSSDGYGWDKASDHNVRVWAAQVPEPGTWLLLLAGAVAVAGTGRWRSSRV